MKRVANLRQALLIAAASFCLSLSAMSSGAVASAAPLAPTTTFAAPASSCANLKLKQTASGKATGQGQSCFVTTYINPAIKLFGGAIAILVVISIIVGAIQYEMSGDDPSKVGAAKDRIRNAFIALLAYLFMLAFLNWIVPGGVT